MLSPVRESHCLLLLLLLTLGLTPEPVEAGPATTAACILGCCGTACASAAAVCELPLATNEPDVKAMF